MAIKPKFNTSTINFSAPVKAPNLNSKIVKDPAGIISNGIYKVIRWEKLRQLFIIIIAGMALLSMGILIALYATIIPTGWIGFILPTAVIIYAFYKFITSLVDRGALKKGVAKYKEDLRMGLTSHPPFIIRLYKRLFEKQIAHNWLTFFLLINGGLFTLALWGLKNVHWWIFKFDVWIHALFSDPNTMQWILTFALIAVAFLHICFAIQRKRRIMEIDSYFGANIISMQDLEAIKVNRNKAYRRLFLIYVMVILIIPILLKLVLKVLRRK